MFLLNLDQPSKVSIRPAKAALVAHEDASNVTLSSMPLKGTQFLNESKMKAHKSCDLFFIPLQQLVS